MALDLGSLTPLKAANEGVDVPIYHPATNEATGIVLHVAGADSDVYRSATRAAQRRRMAQMERGGKLKLTPEELEAEALNLLVVCILSWKGVEWGGAPLDCTADNARKVLEAHPWLRDQVDAAVGDRALFLGK